MMRFRHGWVLIAGILIALDAGPSKRAVACSVPVFRYALANWPAEPYDALVLHRGSLRPADVEALEKLRDGSIERSPYSNVRVAVVDLDEQTGEVKEKIEAIWGEADSPALPCMILRYPLGEKVKGTVWSGPLTEENAAILLDSPARREIAQRLVGGHSAVWVLLESGDSENDVAAEAMLQDYLKKMEQTLKLPEDADEIFTESAAGRIPVGESLTPRSDGLPESLFLGETSATRQTTLLYTEQTVGLSTETVSALDAGTTEPLSGLPLAIRFSVVPVSRKDPAESIFIEMLQRSEPDLTALASQPIAFPFFGRGRALYALVGQGINKETVAEACGFLVGPCSCQAKDLNPGTDMLIAADWEAGLQPVSSQPLVGLETLAKVAGGSSPAATDEAPGVSGGTFLRNTLIALAAIVAGTLALLLWILRVKPRDPA